MRKSRSIPAFLKMTAVHERGLLFFIRETQRHTAGLLTTPHINTALAFPPTPPGYSITTPPAISSNRPSFNQIDSEQPRRIPASSVTRSSKLL